MNACSRFHAVFNKTEALQLPQHTQRSQHYRARSRIRPTARLFQITRLHSHEPSVAVETASSLPTSELTAASIALEFNPAEPVAEANKAPDSTTFGSTVTGTASRTPPAGSRAALQSAAGRKLLYPTARAIKYLDGSLPGDVGFDPLGLADPGPKGQPGEEQVMNLKWLSYAELIHGRWAMVAAAGAIAPEFLGLAGVIPKEIGLPWFEAGGLFCQTPGCIQGIPFLGDIPFTYWTDAGTLMYTMFTAMGFAELRRLQDYRYPGSMSQQYFLGLENIMHGSGDAKYPGGRFFNMFNLGGKLDSQQMWEMKVKEVKNGRLAMVAWLGFMVQACTTHKGPVQNMLDHMADPSTNNIAAHIGDFFLTTTPLQQISFVLWLGAGVAAGALYNYAEDGRS